MASAELEDSFGFSALRIETLLNRRILLRCNSYNLKSFIRFSVLLIWFQIKPSTTLIFHTVLDLYQTKDLSFRNKLFNFISYYLFKLASLMILITFRGIWKEDGLALSLGRSLFVLFYTFKIQDSEQIFIIGICQTWF